MKYENIGKLASSLHDDLEDMQCVARLSMSTSLSIRS